MAARAQTYNRRGRGRGGGGYQRAPARGMFKDNTWYCDCDPPLPAEHFKVKKEGKNQGRWFYTCQQSETKRCPFFLWDEDAKLREEAAILANSHAEPNGNVSNKNLDGLIPDHAEVEAVGGSKSNARATHVSQHQIPRATSHGSHLPETPVSHKTKRTAFEAGLHNDEDEEFERALGLVEEQGLAQAIETRDPHAPNKAAKMGVYATPSSTVTTKRKIPWLQPLEVSPSQSHSVNNTPSKTLSLDRTVRLATPELEAAFIVDPHSPRPASRFKDALVDPADASASLTVEALSILATTTLPGDVIAKLRGVLSKHDLRTRGVTKGRDISRLALKAKDAKIAELEAKIVSLQADREVDRSIIRNLRWARDHGDELEEETQDEL